MAAAPRPLWPSVCCVECHSVAVFLVSGAEPALTSLLPFFMSLPLGTARQGLGVLLGFTCSLQEKGFCLSLPSAALTMPRGLLREAGASLSGAACHSWSETLEAAGARCLVCAAGRFPFLPTATLAGSLSLPSPPAFCSCGKCSPTSCILGAQAVQKLCQPGAPWTAPQLSLGEGACWEVLATLCPSPPSLLCRPLGWSRGTQEAV